MSQLMIITYRGNVVFVSSYAGFKPVSFDMLWKSNIIIRYFSWQKTVYCVSKTALFGLTMGLAKELGEDNIRVNCVAPGLIRTRFRELVSVT